MNEPPVMISTKDLAYLSDMFEWNFTVSKVAYDFEGKIQNPEIKELVNRIHTMHVGICNKIIQILGGTTNE